MGLDSERALRTLKKHQQHCVIAHGDNVSATCDTCKTMMLEFLDAIGMDPTAVHSVEDTCGVPEHFAEAARFFNRMFPRETEVSAWD